MLTRMCGAALLATLSFSAAVAEGIPVEGRVVAPDGAALAEATVKLFPLRGEPAELAAIVAGEDVAAVAEARSGAEGRFLLEAPHAGLWRVRIAAPGFAPLEAELLPLIEPVMLPDAEPLPDAGIRVEVRDPEGGPVAGARVLARAGGSSPFASRKLWNVPLQSGVTTEDGRVRLPRGEGARVSVSASSDRYATAERRDIRGTATRLTLPEGHPRVIEVRSRDGRAIAGALISSGDLSHPLGLTGSTGRRTVRLAGRDEHPVTADAPDGRRVEMRLTPPPPDPERTEPAVARFVLPDLLPIAGRLIDAESRQAIAGGLVWDRDRPRTVSVTGSSGDWRLTGPRDAMLDLTSAAPGYLPGATLRRKLQEDQRPGPTLVLEPGATVEGKVVDGNGRPIAGAEVSVTVRKDPSTFRIEIGGPPARLPRNRTDPRGRFRVGPLDPEKNWSLQVEAEGFARGEAALTGLEPYGTRSDVEVTLVRGRGITGRVVDGDGDPIPAAAVELRAARPSGGRGMMRMAPPSPAEPTRVAETDDDGGFVLDGLADGAFDLEVRRRGFAPGRRPGIEVSGEDDAPVELGEIVLSLGERVQGRVSDEDGRPIEGVEVFAQEGGDAMMSFRLPGQSDEPPDAVSDVQGWFVVEDLAAGTPLSLRLERRGYVSKTAATIELPHPEPLELRLDASSIVSGRVVDPDGEPVVSAQVGLTRMTTIEMGGNVLQTVIGIGSSTDRAGEFRFEDQEPGTITLTASSPGFRETRRDGVEIPRGEDLDDVELPLEPGAVLEGRIVGPDGRAALGADVHPMREEHGPRVRMFGNAADGDGHYRVDGLEPGPISIEAKHPDYPRLVRDLELKPGVNRLDLAFAGGQAVSGRVTDASGKAVPGALLRLTTPRRFWGGREARTGGDGRFELPGVPNGTYELWAEAEGYATAAEGRRVTVEDAPVENLELALERGATIRGRISGLESDELPRVSVRAQGAMHRGGGDGIVDREGHYRVPHLPSGEYTVRAELGDSGRQAIGRVTLPPDTPDARLDLRFGEGITLSGTAVQGEKPLAGMTVFAQGLDVEHSGWSRTDRQGRFSIEGLERGRYRVALRDFSTGLAHLETFDLATSREIEIDVPTVEVSGRIVSRVDRQPIAGATLSLAAPETDEEGLSPTHGATTDVDGRFRFRAVGDGSWRLTARRKGYAAHAETVEVRHQRAPRELRIALDPTEGLTLQVGLPGGEPASSVDVAVVDAAGTAITGGGFDAGENGRVRLSTVPPGSWTLIVSSPGAATVEVAATAPGPVQRLALPPATRLGVEVPALAGSPTLARATVTDANGRRFRSLTWNARPRSEWPLSGGRIEFVSLPPGTWTVTVTTTDGHTWSGTAATNPGADTKLVLEDGS